MEATGFTRTAAQLKLQKQLDDLATAQRLYRRLAKWHAASVSGDDSLRVRPDRITKSPLQRMQLSQEGRTRLFALTHRLRNVLGLDGEGPILTHQIADVLEAAETALTGSIKKTLPRLVR